MIASAVFLLTAVVATMFYLRAYRPTRAPVVEQARIPQDVRAKASTGAKLRLRRRAARNSKPVRPPVSSNIPASPELIAAPAAPAPQPVAVPEPVAAAPRTPAPRLVHGGPVHDLDGAAQPGSYFRNVEAPSPETILSDVRGPWAANIVAADGRISLPDNGMDVAVSWAKPEETPPAGSYLS